MFSFFAQRSLNQKTEFILGQNHICHDFYRKFLTDTDFVNIQVFYQLVHFLTRSGNLTMPVASDGKLATFFRWKITKSEPFSVSWSRQLWKKGCVESISVSRLQKWLKNLNWGQCQTGALLAINTTNNLNQFSVINVLFARTLPRWENNVDLNERQLDIPWFLCVQVKIFKRDKKYPDFS